MDTRTCWISDTNRSVEGFGISPDGGTLPLVRVNVPANQLTTWRPGQGTGSLARTCFPRMLCASRMMRVSVGNRSWVRFLPARHVEHFAANGSTLNYLASLVGEQETRALTTTYDGSITVGQSGLQPVAWLQNSPVSIPTLEGSHGGVASVVNSDASIVGGAAYFDTEVPWIWSESTGLYT